MFSSNSIYLTREQILFLVLQELSASWVFFYVASSFCQKPHSLCWILHVFGWSGFVLLNCTINCKSSSNFCFRPISSIWCCCYIMSSVADVVKHLWLCCIATDLIRFPCKNNFNCSCCHHIKLHIKFRFSQFIPECIFS